jgi:hypothetical protein
MDGTVRRHTNPLRRNLSILLESFAQTVALKVACVKAGEAKDVPRIPTAGKVFRPDPLFFGALTLIHPTNLSARGINRSKVEESDRVLGE